MYLSQIRIENYKGIKNLAVSFQKDINIIIGENGSRKTALIDSLRLLYNLGKQQREIFVTAEDFYLNETVISIDYEFRGLTPDQKGAFYEYLVLGATEADDFAKITLTYKKENQRIFFSYYTGEIEGQKADSDTFQFFIHYYLGALRDSTKDLITNRNNILGNLIIRQVEINKSQSTYESLIKDANKELLKLKEVVDSRHSINRNLSSIYRQSVENQIGLRIEESRAEYIVNIIKPYLPHDIKSLEGEGFNLRQNSLGFNNLIYIATVLGDISQQLKSDSTSHYILLIEEPEAHLHPQLQLNLYEFLKQTNNQDNSQLFITTHSPTLTSKVPLDNLIHISKDSHAINIYKCFEKREKVSVTEPDEDAFEDDPSSRKKQLERYIDVTKSQLFFAKGILFVEGISEALLVPIFAQVLDCKLEDFKIELVSADGTSFYPFIYLFNSTDDTRTLPTPLAILTDDDRFTESKNTEYSFKNIKDNLPKAEELALKIALAVPNSRVDNINEAIKSCSAKIFLGSAYKTFEFAIIQTNITVSKSQISENLLWRYLLEEKTVSKKVARIKAYLDGVASASLSKSELDIVQILIWKALPAKAEFAQNFSLFLLQNMKDAKTHFNVPDYISKAIIHLTTYKRP
jgi:putative ATP-dependent endonuclease of the OLD family